MTPGQAGQVEAMSYQCGGSFNKLEQVPALPPSKIIKRSSSSTSLYKCMQMWLWVKNKGLERLALCISQPQGGQNQVLRKTWSLLLIRNSDSESTFSNSTTLLRVLKYPFFSTTPWTRGERIIRYSNIIRITNIRIRIRPQIETRILFVFVFVQKFGSEYYSYSYTDILKIRILFA